MSNSFVSNRIHCVFSTKERHPFLTVERRPRLHAYISSIAKNLGAEPIAVGGFDDHIHILVALPSKLSLAEFVQKVKANSSRWMKDTFALPSFAWQEGYSAFSVSINATQAVENYVNGQEKHHRKRDFRAELELMLRTHGVRVEDLPSYGL